MLRSPVLLGRYSKGRDWGGRCRPTGLCAKQKRFRRWNLQPSIIRSIIMHVLKKERTNEGYMSFWYLREDHSNHWYNHGKWYVQLIGAWCSHIVVGVYHWCPSIEVTDKERRFIIVPHVIDVVTLIERKALFAVMCSLYHIYCLSTTRCSLRFRQYIMYPTYLFIVCCTILVILLVTMRCLLGRGCFQRWIRGMIGWLTQNKLDFNLATVSDESRKCCNVCLLFDHFIGEEVHESWWSGNQFFFVNTPGMLPNKIAITNRTVMGLIIVAETTSMLEKSS